MPMAMCRLPDRICLTFQLDRYSDVRLVLYQRITMAMRWAESRQPTRERDAVLVGDRTSGADTLPSQMDTYLQQLLASLALDRRRSFCSRMDENTSGLIDLECSCRPTRALELARQVDWPGHRETSHLNPSHWVLHLDSWWARVDIELEKEGIAYVRHSYRTLVENSLESVADCIGEEEDP